MPTRGTKTRSRRRVAIFAPRDSPIPSRPICNAISAPSRRNSMRRVRQRTRGTYTRQPTVNAARISGLVSSSSGRATYTAIRELGRSSPARRACAATVRPISRRRTAETPCRNLRSRRRRDLRSAVISEERTDETEEEEAPPACAVTGHCSRHRATSGAWSRQVRLSARSGLAQCCRAALAPWVSTLGSRGNPTRIEHRRRRQTEDTSVSGRRGV